MVPSLVSMRNYFESGATVSLEFRLARLTQLRASVLKYEPQINQALYADLKKNPAETYATESGLLLSEINRAIKHLPKWMQPRKVPTNLMNLPSSSKIYYDPLGVVLIIAPWNYPFQLSLIPLVGAIAGGNCAVLKPSELAPATAVVIEEILREIFPPEYVRIIQGDGASCIPSLMESFRFDHVFYTGSVQVGKIIYQLAARDLVPVTLELGGKSPALVASDARLPAAARRIAVGKFSNAGQTCVAPDYLLVHASIKAPLIERLSQTITDFYGADPGASPNYGKIIHVKRFDTLMQYLTQGRIVFGGQYDRAKLFLAPTLIEDVSLDSPMMREEIFGPILPVFAYQTDQEALEIIRRNPNPLSFYIFSADSKKQEAWIRAIPFGGGCVNNSAWHFANPHIPFGGIGMSGIGAYHGKYSFDRFTHAKPVMNTPTWIDPDLKYPPFEGKLAWYKRLIR